MIVVNKWWEADPVMAVLLNAYIRPAALPNPDECHGTWEKAQPGQQPPRPRAIYRAGQDSIEVWCISDLLKDLPPSWQSSTQHKAERMGTIMGATTPDLVVAVGTAGYPDSVVSYNGCVTIGSKVLVHNYHPNGENPDSNWVFQHFDELLDSAISEDAFQALTSWDVVEAHRKLVSVPNNPAEPRFLMSSSHVSLGDVNVTDYGEYTTPAKGHQKAGDDETVDAFLALSCGHTAVSLETTHGMIRTCTGAPFLFISGITDRLGHFDAEVSPAQNFAAAFNAGVAVAYLIPRIWRFLQA